VAEHVTVDANTHLEGIFLVKRYVAFEAGGSLNGRILAQEAATLGASCTITKPTAPTTTHH
jgi:hypothetical protein